MALPPAIALSLLELRNHHLPAQSLLLNRPQHSRSWNVGPSKHRPGDRSHHQHFVKNNAFIDFARNPIDVERVIRNDLQLFATRLDNSKAATVCAVQRFAFALPSFRRAVHSQYRRISVLVFPGSFCPSSSNICTLSPDIPFGSGSISSSLGGPSALEQNGAVRCRFRPVAKSACLPHDVLLSTVNAENGACCQKELPLGA